MKQVILMRAIPGSGKSTLTKQLAQTAILDGKTVAVCSADSYFYNLGDGEYKFDPSKLRQAHGQCFESFKKAISNDVNLIIVDNTNLQIKHMVPYKEYAESHGYSVKVNQVHADKDLAFKRQQHGVHESGHTRMYNDFSNKTVPAEWDTEDYISETDTDGNPKFELQDRFALMNLINMFVKCSEKY